MPSWAYRFVGAIGYADGVALMAPSFSAAQKMLNLCSEFSKEFLCSI
jgi:hypothetical protein